jgi:hypothetical protein
LGNDFIKLLREKEVKERIKEYYDQKRNDVRPHNADFDCKEVIHFKNNNSNYIENEIIIERRKDNLVKLEKLAQK